MGGSWKRFIHAIVWSILNSLSHPFPHRKLFESTRRSMAKTDDSTMVASEATGTAFKQVEPKNKSKRLKTSLVVQILIQQKHKYTICAYFPMPHANTKFNPISSMHLFFKEMLKYDSMIMVIINHDEQQIQLAHDVIPMLEEKLKFFYSHKQYLPEWNTAACDCWMSYDE